MNRLEVEGLVSFQRLRHRAYWMILPNGPSAADAKKALKRLPSP